MGRIEQLIHELPLGSGMLQTVLSEIVAQMNTLKTTVETLQADYNDLKEDFDVQTAAHNALKAQVTKLKDDFDVLAAAFNAHCAESGTSHDAADTTNDVALEDFTAAKDDAAAWIKNTAYVLGDQITNDSKIYICITAGTSEDADDAGPKTTSADITDGTAHWKYLIVAASVSVAVADLIAPNHEATAWVKNTAYVLGDQCTNGSAVYICITAGTSENADDVGPLTTAADITDGTAHWKYLGAVNTAGSAITFT
jgi:hypothetical protein